MSHTYAIRPSLDLWGAGTPLAALEYLMQQYPGLNAQCAVEHEGRALPIRKMIAALSPATAPATWAEDPSDWQIEEDRHLAIGGVVVLDFGVEILVTSIGRLETGIGGNFRNFSGKQKMMPAEPAKDGRKWIVVKCC